MESCFYLRSDARGRALQRLFACGSMVLYLLTCSVFARRAKTEHVGLSLVRQYSVLVGHFLPRPAGGLEGRRPSRIFAFRWLWPRSRHNQRKKGDLGKSPREHAAAPNPSTA